MKTREALRAINQLRKLLFRSPLQLSDKGFATAHELLDELEEYCHERSGSTSQATPPERLGKA